MKENHTGVMQLLSNLSSAGLTGGRYNPFDIISSRISDISLIFSLQTIQEKMIYLLNPSLAWSTQSVPYLCHFSYYVVSIWSQCFHRMYKKLSLNSWTVKQQLWLSSVLYSTILSHPHFSIFVPFLTVHWAHCLVGKCTDSNAFHVLLLLLWWWWNKINILIKWLNIIFAENLDLIVKVNSKLSKIFKHVDLCLHEYTMIYMLRNWVTNFPKPS